MPREGKYTETIERKYLTSKRLHMLAGRTKEDVRCYGGRRGWRKFEGSREREHRWEQSSQHLERVSVLRPTAPVFRRSCYRQRTRGTERKREEPCGSGRGTRKFVAVEMATCVCYLNRRMRLFILAGWIC